MNMFEGRRRLVHPESKQSKVELPQDQDTDVMRMRGKVDYGIDIEDLPHSGLSPEDYVIERETPVIPDYDEEEERKKSAAEFDPADTSSDEPTESESGEGLPEHENPVGGVVGSRRIARYVETPKFPDRKWKRGDKHRGAEKPHKQGRRPTGQEGSDQEDVAA
ncbi:MAG: hypothetical protein Q8P30_01435 [Candidatus Uhrbacteria bacterium]|nr:hypothetical protein [Candidatus Uhrbacteria bacterium]